MRRFTEPRPPPPPEEQGEEEGEGRARFFELDDDIDLITVLQNMHPITRVYIFWRDDLS
jgi:hypothetical protein